MQQGKYQEAETEFKRYIEIDKDRNPHARLELGHLYAIQGMDNDAAKMYESILENLDEGVYDKEKRFVHIQKHMKDDFTKSKHGVFTIDCMELLDTIAKLPRKKKIGYMCDIYSINIPNCGYEGGKDGDRHVLDYVTIVTLPNSTQLITMYPSDELIIEKNMQQSINGSEKKDIEGR